MQGDLRIGQLRRLVRLGTEAVYRVTGWTESSVLVTVVHAPGIEPGVTLTFTREAVTSMEVIAGSDGSGGGS